MLTLTDLKVVSATYEVTVGEYLYRVVTGEGGTIVRRLKLEPGTVEMWSHGTKVETYDANVEAFEPQMVATPKKFKNIGKALDVIKL